MIRTIPMIPLIAAGTILLISQVAFAGKWQDSASFEGKHCSFACESRVYSANGYFYYPTRYWVEEGCEVEEPQAEAVAQCASQCIGGRECFIWRHFCTDECRP
jgi:hypothetical protein